MTSSPQRVTSGRRAARPHLTRPFDGWCKLYGMAQIPTPLRAALGLVANAIEGARTLPDKAVELPVLAVSTALQFSLRAQQRYAEFALRGDELIGRLRGVPEEPPSWATFDDDQGDDGRREDEIAAGRADADEGQPDPVPAPIPIERREPNATARRTSTSAGAESPRSPGRQERREATPGPQSSHREEGPGRQDHGQARRCRGHPDGPGRGQAVGVRQGGRTRRGGPAGGAGAV